MKSDISSREDIHFIIKKFYNKLINDDEMYIFFDHFVKNNTLSHHLEIITDFWEDILFGTYQYKNNPMQKHLDFANKLPFSEIHFQKWLDYFSTTIDNHFSGNKAIIMKNRAVSISTIMQIKLKKIF